MIATLLLGAGLLAAEPAAPAGDDFLKTYETARAAVGRDADAHVKLALWCEARGLTAERARHLALAVLTDPGHAAARGLMGLVAFRGGWKSPQAVAERARADGARAAYLARRARVPGTADGHWRLALWCGENGLTDEAAAHLTAVTRLDPSREAAWKRLGYRRYEGRWMTDAQVAGLKAEREAQAAADRAWAPRLRAWRAALERPGERAGAEARLAALSDPRAVPSVRRVFASGGTAGQARAVAVLRRIDGSAASQTLAALAVWGQTPEVRRAATGVLRGRDPREFVGGLIGLVSEPLKYQVVPVGALGYGSPGFLAVEGKDAILQTVFSVDEVFSDPANARSPKQLGALLGPRLASSPTYEYRVAVQNAQLASLAASVEQARALVGELTARSTTVLREVTGQDAGADPEAWKAWWADQQGYAYDGPAGDPGRAAAGGPALAAQGVTPYVRRPPSVWPRPKPVLTEWVHFSCFAAGTPVQGVAGPSPIEAVRVGDRVLTQDAGTGLLSFQPVVAVYHNPPSATLRVDLGGDPVVATGIHRFWVAGRGWVMARDLKPGDRVRTVGGLTTARDVRDHFDQPVYNLEVARGESFFVGRSGALVHDNSLVRPVDRPFDAPADLTASPDARRASGVRTDGRDPGDDPGRSVAARQRPDSSGR